MSINFFYNIKLFFWPLSLELVRFYIIIIFFGIKEYLFK